MTDTAVSRRYEWQNNIIRIIFSFFIAIGVIVNTVAPFSIVKADYTVGTIISGVQDYGNGDIDLGNNTVYGVRWDLGSSTNGYAWYANPYVNIDGLFKISVFDDYVYYRSNSRSSYSGAQYENLYNLGNISDKYSSSDSNNYAIGYFTGNDFDISNLTKVETGSSILSWTTGNNPYTITANNDIYILGTSADYVYYFSLQPDTVVNCVRSNNTLTFNLTNYVTYGDNTVYYYRSSNWHYSTNYVYGFNWNNTTNSNPYIYAGIVAFQGSGSGSSIDYGEIKDLQYSTNIIASGGSSTGDSNIDTISWYPFWDTNSNISVGWNMEVQVVPATYSSDTQENLFLMSINDLIINYSDAVDIYNGEYSNGSIAVSWGDIKQKLSILQWSDLFSYFDGTYWNKKGWLYRARYTDIESNYTSDWQIVYSVTSSNGEGVEKYIDPSDGTGLPGFYQDVENSFNTTSVVNNNYNVTHIYTGVPMTVNIDDTETSEDITQIKKYVKQIRDILINLNTENSTTENNQNDQEITNNLNSVVDDLHITEDEFMTDMDDKLNNINRNVELLNDNKFIAAANWVRLQYDYLVSDTPFELLIVFGLILSLALIIIGKIR